MSSAPIHDAGAFHRPPRTFPPAIPTEPIVVACPPSRTRRGPGGLIQVLLPVLGSLGIVAFAVITPNKLFLIVACVFVAIALLSALTSAWAQRRTGKLSARNQRRLYRAHLAEREERLKGLAARQRETDERLYPDPVRLVGVAAHRRYLWERRPHDADFLAFRVGHATVPLACPVSLDLPDDPMNEYEPELLDAAQEMVARLGKVEDLSVVAGIGQADVVTIAGARDRMLDLTRSLLAQAAAFRAPADLRILVCFPPEHAQDWDWLKWLPHTRSGRGARAAGPTPQLLMAAGPDELAALLDEHVQPRIEQLRRIESSSSEGARVGVDAPELLVILDGYHAGGRCARLPLVRELAAHGHHLKVHTLCLVQDGDAEPPEAAMRVLVPGDGPATLERTGANGFYISGIRLDQLGNSAAEGLSRSLAPLHLEESAAAIDLASEVRLSELDPPRRGQLCAPIGVSEDGDTLLLDLKQAADGGMGPHGLIVGATGSGKSELLRTIVASLAASHDPDELCFVFVDFKGGAAFADLAGLPHSAGMITNLQHDLSLVDRMYEALFGEQQRRQSMLRAAGNLDDVTAYRTARINRPELEPMPHLLLIVDEFGELLANRPEFIDLFLAIGRVGRSLGMHLLLSSQRLEEGRLRGLEGHLRYRICLRTYSAAESKTVLGSSDAYLLPPFPGVGYLSVDTDVFQRFKTALVTRPHDDGKRRADTRSIVSTFQLAGDAVDQRPAEALSENSHTELDEIVRRLREAASAPVHQVWLPPLPKLLPLSAVAQQPTWWERPPGSAAASGPRACIGLLDRPSEQRQDPFTVDLSGGGGHVAIIGAPQTGKSTLLRTLLSSMLRTASPDEVRVYALDLGGGLLRALADAPHVGGIGGRSDPEQLEATVHQVRALLDEREAVFREHAIDSMEEARRRRNEGMLGPDVCADVLLVIDNWGALLRDFDELAEPLAEIASAGLAHGIHLVITAGRWAELRASMRDAFGTRLELRLNDPLESEFGRKLAEAVPTETPGRGVNADGLYFQTALPRLDGRPNTIDLADAVVSASQELTRIWTGSHAPIVRVLPAQLGVDVLPVPAAPSGIPLGLEELTLAPAMLDLAGSDQHLLILGDSESGRSSALRLIAQGLARLHSDGRASLIVVDFRRGLEDLGNLGLPCRHVTRTPQLEEMMQELMGLCVARLGELDGAPAAPGDRGDPVYVLIDDYDLVASVGSLSMSKLGDIIFQGRDSGIHGIVARTAAGAGRAMLDPVLSRITESGAPSLVMSGDPHDGLLVRGVRGEPLPPGRGRLVRRRGRPVLVQLAFAPAERQDSVPLAGDAAQLGDQRLV
jgi:S-DNA-T family DNA segregation ATPase FtsK/SpoIIIE